MSARQGGGEKLTLKVPIPSILLISLGSLLQWIPHAKYTLDDFCHEKKYGHTCLQVRRGGK
jgi:hypothetical protein